MINPWVLIESQLVEACRLCQVARDAVIGLDDSIPKLERVALEIDAQVDV